VSNDDESGVPAARDQVRCLTDVGQGVRIVQLMHEIRDMPERRIQIDLNCLGRSADIFQVNYLHLKRHLEFCEHDERNQDIWHTHSIVKRDQLATETWRLLHNYVAAAFSLVDHTRIMYRRLNSDGEFLEYRARVDKTFRLSPLAQFVQGLRNYVLHIGEGSLCFQGPIDVKTGRSDIRLWLRTDELLLWSGWNPLAKRFLRESGERVHLASVASDYYDKVRDFHMWYGERQREVRRDDLARFRAKEKEVFLLELDDRLSRFENIPSEVGMGETGLFIGLFDYSDYRELEAIPQSSEARANTALRKLAEHLPVPEVLEARIRSAYKSATFFPPE